jgi:uncharacterized protein YkwD
MSRWSAGIVLVVYALTMTVAVVTPIIEQSQTCCPVPKKPTKPPSLGNPYEMEVINLVNAERTQRGLRPLKPDPTLMAAAKHWSRHQAYRNRMYHSRMGYGENVAYNQKTPYEVQRDWMNSRGHRANILSQRYSQIGVGVAYSNRGQPYWTQTFR